MKSLEKSLCLLLAFAVLALCGCNSNPTSAAPASTAAPTRPPQADVTEPAIDRNAPLSDGKTLKLLAITSSFGLNTTQLLYDVAKAEGCTDVVVGRLYASGCTLKTHTQWAEANNPGYQYTKISDGSYQQWENYSLKFGLENEDWDIIYIQQSAAQAPIESSYGNYLDDLMVYVNDWKTNPNARFVWNMTWAYQSDSTQPVFVDTFKSNQMDMYNAILDVTQKLIVPRTDFDRIIPTGTIIQNARTSAFGDTLTRDTFHLNNYGAIFAAYGLYSVLTGKEITEINLDAVAATKFNGIGSADPILTPLTEEQKAIIIECVNNGIKNPYEVTPSAYPGN